MARKKLLTEGEVRQFMKLAKLGPLSENYFSNNPLEEEGLEDELEATEDELGAEDHLADEEADELGALDAEGGDEDNEALLARVVQAVAAELGVEVDVEGAGIAARERPHLVVDDVEVFEAEVAGAGLALDRPEDLARLGREGDDVAHGREDDLVAFEDHPRAGIARADLRHVQDVGRP